MKKILIVDDDPQNRYLLKLVLQKENIEVIEAETGEDGLKKINDKHPDLIILDVMMPDINGFQIYEKIKDKNIPVIFLTAMADNDFQNEVEYIVKPVDINLLVETVKRYLK